MENRFGFKDLLYTVLFVILIVSLWLMMKQADRQYDVLLSIKESVDGQTSDIATINRRLAQGVSVGSRENAGQSDDDWPFKRIQEVQEREEYAQGDLYIDVFSVIPDRLTPYVSSDAYASTIQGYVLESLASRDPDTLEWQPFIATSWEIEDFSDRWQAYVDKRKDDPLTEQEVKDEAPYQALVEAGNSDEASAYLTKRLEEGRRTQDIAKEADAPVAVTINFDIRPNVTFSDGEPLTVDDVVFTFNWVMDPAVETPRTKAYYEKIRSVEKVDDDTVAFHFNEPYFEAFELAGGMAILPEHFYSQFSPEEFNTATGLLLGSGPYRLPNPTDWRPEPGKPVELVRNDRYWGEPAAFEKLVWRIIELPAARLTTFRNGDIDEFPATPEQYVDLLEDEKLLERTQHFEFQSPTAGYRYIGWNQMRNGKPTVFADKRVRQAMTMLINRERIVDEILLGYGMVISGPFSPLTQQSNKDIKPWPYDEDRARKLLAEAGFADRDNDGVLESKDGKPLRFDLIYPANSDIYERMVLFIKDTMAKAKVVVQPRPLEWSVLIETLKDTRDFDASSLGWSGSIESDPYQIFHSSQIPAPGDNAVHYSNPRLDKLIEDARSTVVEEDRMPKWHEVHAILHEDQPYTFLSAPRTLIFFDDRIQNIRRTTNGLTPLQEWYVPKTRQKWTK